MTDPRQPQGHPTPGHPAPGQPKIVHPTPLGHHPAPTHHHPAGHGLPLPSAARGAPIAPKLAPVDDTPIELITDEEQIKAENKKIVAYGGGIDHRHHDWKRKTNITGQGACRVRSFHGKYSDQGLEYLDNAINEWLDAHPEIEVKFVTSTVMTFEGKVREPALVLNVWY
jgi:hypothetical protein